MKTAEVIAAEEKYIVSTYKRPDVVFSHGEGCYLYDTEGKRYLDFAAGIAVTSLGHADAAWVAAVQDQAAHLAHVSNLYHTLPHVALAQRLVEHSFADKVFFCNSGGEANEAALKFARKYAKVNGNESKTKIVAFSGGFHGRSIGALSTTYKAKYRRPFAPLMPGVVFSPFNDVAAAEEAIDDQTCAVIVEPIQGEGGVHPAQIEFLHGLRQLCDVHGALLIFDEVQCGLGRSGRLWAHQRYGVTPDIMTLAKPLAGGLPIGATLVSEAVAEVMEPGDHGSTFAAGPLVCRAAAVVFDRINQPDFLESVRQKGDYLQDRLWKLPPAQIGGVRGAGLLVGVALARPAKDIVDAARQQGLLIISAGENVIRLAPPLIVSEEQIDTAVEVIGSCLAS